MPALNSKETVRQQYSDDKNLSARIKLHSKHSTNKKGFVPWLFEQYRFLSNDKILELGCGNGGQWEGRIEHLPPGCTLILSDYSEGMVDIVREKFSQKHPHNVSFMQIDIQSIPFQDESFNAVIANHMLYHVPDLNKALQEARRVLAADGCFYATTGGGGIREFSHNAVKMFDPETKAFSQTLAFNLQNGEEILTRYFPSVERSDYIDSLSVTETQDLVDWIKSSSTVSGYPEEMFNDLYEHFEGIRIREGAINIPKEAGLFICKK